MPVAPGTGVLVTRPRDQAQGLCALLEQAGARVWRLPVLEIRSLAFSPPEGPFDLAVFTSANAVRFGLGVLTQLSGTPLAAIGPATARALAQSGHPATVQPAGRFDSESLLTQPSLQRAAGRRVLLVKGRGGRALLAAELQARGAQVSCSEVYERLPLVPDATDLQRLEQLAQAGELQVVTATSLEIGLRLLEVLPSSVMRAPAAALWVVPSTRIAEALTRQGLHVPIHVARSAEDHDLLAAVLEARAPSSA